MMIRLEVACRAVCDRCRNSRWQVTQDTGGEWWHSAEVTPEGVGIPPEPCAAQALRDMADPVPLPADAEAALRENLWDLYTCEERSHAD